VAAIEVYERVEHDQRGSNTYIAHQAKIWLDHTLTDSVHLIVSMFPME
jgi:hypothetical protein